MRGRCSFDWGWSYPVFVVLLGAIFWPPATACWKADKEAEKVAFSEVPVMQLPELVSVIGTFEGILDAEPSGNPHDYYSMVEGVYAIQRIAQKHVALTGQHGFANPELWKVRRTATSFRLRITPVRGRYTEKFGYARMAEAGEEYRELYGDLTLREARSASYAAVWPLLSTAYVESLLVALFLFIVRLRRNDFNIPIECWRLALASTLWPGALFVYPYKITRDRQVREALLFASYAIVTVLSLGGATGAAKAQGKSGVKRKSDVVLIDKGSLVSTEASDPPQVLPTVIVGGASVDLSGWAWLSFVEDADREFDLSMLRLRVNVESTTPVGAFAELDLTSVPHGGSLAGDWLKQAQLSYELARNWELRIGRHFLAAGYPTPPPFLMEHANFVRWPFGLNAWGLQLSGSHGKWSLVADLTGRSDLQFDDPGQLERTEFSANVGYQISDAFAVGGTTQLSSEFARISADMSWSPTREHLLRGSLYASSAEDVFGGFAFYAYRPTGWFELHSLLDGQVEGGEGDLIWTNGVRVSSKDDYISLVLDYEVPVGPDHLLRDARLLARVQLRF